MANEVRERDQVVLVNGWRKKLIDIYLVLGVPLITALGTWGIWVSASTIRNNDFRLQGDRFTGEMATTMEHRILSKAESRLDERCETMRDWVERKVESTLARLREHIDKE